MSVLVGEESTVEQESYEARARLLAQMNEEEKKLTEAKRKRDSQSPYKAFVQFNIADDISKARRALIRENPNAWLILDFILQHMDNYNALVCSYAVFQEALSIGRTTVSNAIKLLKERGFLYVQKSGSSNVYLLNTEIAWKSWGKNTKYCKFPANVILSGSEQVPEEPAIEEMRQKMANIKVTEE